jgi:hypothetical protein
VTDFYQRQGVFVQIGGELGKDIAGHLRIAQMLDDAMQREMREALLDMTTDSPRLGPRRVLNDAQQSELERRQALADVLEDVALEWGVLDLIQGDEW